MKVTEIDRNSPYYEPSTDKRWSRTQAKGLFKQKVKAPYHCVQIVDLDELQEIRKEKQAFEESSAKTAYSRKRNKAIKKLLNP